MSVWSSGSYREGSFLVRGFAYFCACALAGLLHLQPFSLPLEPSLTALHQACRLSGVSSLPGSLWGVPWMGAPLPGSSFCGTRVSCLSVPIFNLQKPFVEVSQCSFVTDAFALARPNNCRNTVKMSGLCSRSTVQRPEQLPLHMPWSP